MTTRHVGTVVSNQLQDIYCASRSLYGLARDGQAPRIFARARENGNPIFAVAFTSMFIGLCYMNASKSSSTVFGYLVSLVTVFAVLNWVAILVSHIRFRQALKAQGIVTTDLPYVGVFQPYGSYFALIIFLLVIVFNGKKSTATQIVVVTLTTTLAFQATMRSFPISKLIFSFSSILDRSCSSSMPHSGKVPRRQLSGMQQMWTCTQAGDSLRKRRQLMMRNGTKGF
jgi:amino acid permease